MKHLTYLLLVACTACGTSIIGSRDEPLRLNTTETVIETSSGLPFVARIDTGAHSCSLHYEEMEIQNASKDPKQNIGKPVRFLVANNRGGSGWITATIADYVRVRTSEQAAGRYKVRLTLCCQGIEKEVLVTLNQRHHMSYPMLVGRNFLRNDFVVAVE